MSAVRIDKFLWAVRLFKTRARAADFCKKGKVSIGTKTAKPSSEVKTGDVINLRKGPVTLSFSVLALAQNRMGAKLVPNFLLDVTSKQQRELLEMQRLAQLGGRQRGQGRPTKKDRRDIVEFQLEQQGYAHDDNWLEDFLSNPDSEDDAPDPDFVFAPNNL